MITVVSILLVIILLGLLVDWRRILKRRAETPPGSAMAPRSGSKSKDFSFDALSEEAADPEESGLGDEESGSAPVTPEVAQMLEEADVHFRKNEMKAAEQLYLKAAAEDPRCSKAYSRLGIIYLENGENWEDAEACFRQALKVEPLNGYILNNLGLVLYHQDKYADAIRQFEQAVRQDEYNASRYANLGMAYMAMRQYAKAESAFKRALKLSPNEMEYRDLLNESIEKKKAHKTMVRSR